MTHTYTNTMACPACGGVGWINKVELCQVCRGAGVIPVMTKQIADAGQPGRKKKKTAARQPVIVRQPEIFEPEIVYEQPCGDPPGTRQAVPIHLYIHGAGSVQPGSVQPGSVQPGDNEYYQTCQAGTVRPEPEKTAQPEKKEGFSLASLAIIAFTIFVILCMAMEM